MSQSLIKKHKIEEDPYSHSQSTIEEETIRKIRKKNLLFRFKGSSYNKFSNILHKKYKD
jgi:hypothetical protein